jgi:hypothetical protein
MTDFDHMSAFEGRLVRREHRFDRSHEIPFEEERRLGRNAIACGGRDATASVSQAHEPRSEVPDLSAKPRLEDGPDKGFDILAPFIVCRVNVQTGRD